MNLVEQIDRVYFSLQCCIQKEIIWLKPFFELRRTQNAYLKKSISYKNLIKGSINAKYTQIKMKEDRPEMET